MKQLVSAVPLEAPYQLDDSELMQLASQIRKKVFETCLYAKSGHIGGSSGAVELLTTLYFGGILRFNPADARDNRRDRVLIRGHLGPVRYSIFAKIGFVEEKELKTYRKIGSRLQGHENHRLTPGVDITPSGSLGMLLSYGVGAAVASRYKGPEFRTFVFIGDGEEQEGNISEAARHAARLGLGNLIAIIDANGKQLSNPISDVDTANLEMIWKGYGWDVIVLEKGHDIPSIRAAYTTATEHSGPVVIIARTQKGKDLIGANAHFSGFHSLGVCPREIVVQGINMLSNRGISLKEIHTVASQMTDKSLRQESFSSVHLDIKPDETHGGLSLWQEKYFCALKDSSVFTGLPVFFLTADTTRKDFVDALSLRDFMFYDNLGLREQHLFAFVHGLSTTIPSARIIINSFDAFVYRGMDQLNAMASGGGSVIILGDYAGLTNARNGETHQSAAQPAALTAIPHITVLEPWNSVDLFNSFNWALGESRGVVYMRLHAGPVPVHRAMPSNERPLSWYRILGSANADITLVSSGLTIGSCLGAAERMLAEGTRVNVINIVHHNQLSEEFVAQLPTGRPVLTVYNGSSNFLQERVSAAVMRNPVHVPSCIHGIGFETGTSGLLEELLCYYGLDTNGVYKSAKMLL